MPDAERQDLEKAVERLSPEDRLSFFRAVAAQAVRRHRAFVEGVGAYRRHPYRRPEAVYPTLWQQGTTRLLDCRPDGADNPPVLLIPSLINRAYILDLRPRISVVRGLSKRGVSPYLLDWGAPGNQEKDFRLTDYIRDRIEPALDHLYRSTGRPVALLGYCMGGLLAVAQALRRPAQVSCLTLLATPWDFHRGVDVPRAFLSALIEDLRRVIGAQGQMSVDMLQALFTVFDPDLTARKFTAFKALPPRSGQAKEFVLLEDWANDGVPLVEGVAVECLDEWYVNNTPFLGRWTVDGCQVRPEQVVCPSLVVVPKRDRIVTPASALALSQCLPACETLQIPGGHVGMLLSRHVGRLLHAPIAAHIKKWAGGA